MERFLISPPFGNWISLPGCTRVMGSYTIEARSGLLKQAFKTIRPVHGGWVNRIGLRNPGIHSVRFEDDRIYSIVGIQDGDWERLYEALPKTLSYLLELNLGCPNAITWPISVAMLREFAKTFAVIAKLSPTETVQNQIQMCVESGVRYVHLCNTIPTDRGGESGSRLKRIVLPLIEETHNRYPDLPIIAGGGIYSASDVMDYYRAGASHFSLGTVFFAPWRLPLLFGKLAMDNPWKE